MDFVTNDQNTAPRRSRRGLLWKIALVVFLIFGIYFYWKYYFTVSSGDRVGLLQKLSYKGTLFKTYEGEMILNNIRMDNTGLGSEKFIFSVDDKETADKLMALQGHMVIAHYKQKNGTLSWRGESPYIVDSVRVDSSLERRY